MVTKIASQGTLHLRAHRKARGMSAQEVADKMGMERESLLRLEREWRTRCNPEKQSQYAQAIGVAFRALWGPPETPSVDTMLAETPSDFQAMIIDTVRRKAGGA